MSINEYYRLKSWMNKNYPDELTWAENISICTSAFHFVNETIWVILNSGMKEQIARQIWNRIQKAIHESKPISEVFGHKGKVKAINDIIGNCNKYFDGWRNAPNQLEYLQTIPFIGKITRYHLAKNLGMDVCKPDRHLMRIALAYNKTPAQLCDEIKNKTGDAIRVIDSVIWRAANQGLV